MTKPSRPKYLIDDVEPECDNTGRRYLATAFALLLAAGFALILAACSVQSDLPSETTDKPETVITTHDGPFWAAFIVYFIGVDETRLGIGPFIDEGECRERVIAEMLSAKDMGAVVSYGKCVVANEMGHPIEMVEPDNDAI